jgi:hypothetical protein
LYTRYADAARYAVLLPPPGTFVTAEPYPGHFGLGGVGNSAQRLERFPAHLKTRKRGLVVL